MGYTAFEVRFTYHGRGMPDWEFYGWEPTWDAALAKKKMLRHRGYAGVAIVPGYSPEPPPCW